jgi:hypothetical protein
MVALLRFLIVLAVVQTVVFLIVTTSMRSRYRSRAEAEWDADDREGDRDAWVDDEVEAHMDYWRRPLLWLIYLVPLAAITAFIYINNQ